MSLGTRFNPARGLLTGVALENNDALAAGLPAEELPPVEPATGDALDAPAPAADPAAPAADPIAVDPAAVAEPAAADPVAEPAAEPAAEPVVDPITDPDATPAAEPAAEPVVPAAEPAADPVPAADPINEENPIGEPDAEPAAPAADPVVEPAAEPAAPAAEPVAPVAEPAPVVPEATPAAAPAAVVPDAVPAAEPAADPIQEDPLAELATVDTQLGEQDAGIESSMGEVAATTNEIQDGTNNVSELHSIADALEETLEDGGAPAAAISIANIAVEHAVMRMNGGHKPKRLLPALEAFGGLQRRSASTTLAIESLRGTAATAGERIMAFINKCIGFLKSLIQKIVDNFGGMKQKLAALQAAVKQGSLAQDAVKIHGNIASRLQLGGKFGKQQFVKGMKSLRNFMAKVESLLGVAAKTTASADLTQAGADGEFPSIDASALGAAVHAFGGKSAEAEEGSVTVTYMEALPGNATAHATGPDGAVVGDIAYRAVGSVDVNITSMSQESDTFVEVDETVTEAEFAQMSRELAASIASAERMRAVMNTIIQAQSKAVAMVTNATRAAGEGGGKIVAAAQSFASRASSSLTRTVSKAMTYIRSVLTAALGYLSGFVSAKAAPAQEPAAA